VMRSGPVIIGCAERPGPSSPRARRPACLRRARAWWWSGKWDAPFEAATLPVKALEMPPAAVDVLIAFEAGTVGVGPERARGSAG
jgi:hypothetical protein